MNIVSQEPDITVWVDLPEHENGTWNDAYLRFETPDQEVGKFKKRLKTLGAAEWPREAAIVELFCGRGNGLTALESLGFTRLEGVDLSQALLAEYPGSAKLYAGDCRDLKFPDSSKDVLIVQGGLHHLPSIPADLDAVLKEAVRVLRPGGRFVCVEPWLTPFLRCVHALCGSSLFRGCWPKLDALAVMIEHERVTYENWLSSPGEIKACLLEHFASVSCRQKLGKLSLVGEKPA